MIRFDHPKLAAAAVASELLQAGDRLVDHPFPLRTNV